MIDENDENRKLAKQQEYQASWLSELLSFGATAGVLIILLFVYQKTRTDLFALPDKLLYVGVALFVFFLLYTFTAGSSTQSPWNRLLVWLKESVSVIFASAFIVLLLNSFVFFLAVVPTGSMIPTLMEQDRIVVNRLAYIGNSKIARGDVVVFDPPPTIDFEGKLVKRAMGLPGDKVEVANGKLLINDVPLAEPYVKEAIGYTMPAIIVPDNSYFMMGDNRNDSYDSHSWGFLDQSYVIGKASFVFWPIEHFKKLGSGIDAGN